MELQGKLLGAWLLTYFVSRLTMRLPYPFRQTLRIGLAHLLSLAAIILLVAVVRGPVAALSADLLMVCAAPQTFWWLFDLLRKHRPGSHPKRSR
jgi:hypothetical protein